MFYSVFYSNFQWLKSTWNTQLLFLSCPNQTFSRNKNESIDIGFPKCYNTLCFSFRYSNQMTLWTILPK